MRCCSHKLGHSLRPVSAMLRGALCHAWRLFQGTLPVQVTAKPEAVLCAWRRLLLF